LGGGELLVEDNHVGAILSGLRDDRGGLAGADEKLRRRAVAQVHEDGSRDRDLEVFHEFLQLAQQLGSLARIHARRLDADEQRARYGFLIGEKICHSRKQTVTGLRAESNGAQTRNSCPTVKLVVKRISRGLSCHTALPA